MGQLKSKAVKDRAENESETSADKQDDVGLLRCQTQSRRGRIDTKLWRLVNLDFLSSSFLSLSSWKFSIRGSTAA